MLNIFRMAADGAHMVSIVILLHSIHTKQSAKGISVKTQILYVLVYLTRYIDLFFYYVSLYNTLMKIFFIASSIYTVYLLKKYTKQISENLDDFKIKYLIVPSLVLSLIFNYAFTATEILWAFSLFLESVCIFPQLFVLQKSGEAELLTIHYIFALGLYRALYIPNWIWRYFAEGHLDKLVIVTGIVQTLIYSDFFYVYYQKVIKNVNFSLPA